MTMAPVRLLLTKPASGAWNMALDEALLQAARQHGDVCLRFYGWAQPTLSLGYFQAVADRQQHPDSGDCPVVRRATGGGAILHDHELTYSFAAPVAGHARTAVQDFYLLFHETLIQALAEWGIGAGLAPNPPQPSGRQEPFLCFQRRAPTDVLLEGAKIAGSAQRRHKGAVLQHGSILLQTSPCAPELEGIEQLSGTAIDPQQLIPAWTAKLSKRSGWEVTAGSVAPAYWASAESFHTTRFACESWNCRK